MTDNTQTPSSLFPSNEVSQTEASPDTQPTLPSTLFPTAKNSGPMSGAYADVYFANGIPSFNDVGSVMSHIGQGAAQAWGANINTLPKAADQVLTKAGVYNDYTKNEHSYFKTLNEELVRPVVNSLLPLGAGVLGGLQGAFQGLGSTLETHAKQGEETFGANPISATLGEAGEIIGSIPERVPEFPNGFHFSKSIPELTAEARSKAVIGEGEQGFFNTKPISEENIQARQSAAEQAGMPTPTVPQQPEMDIHSVVRQMDPVLFQEVDRLNDIKASALQSRDYAQSQDIDDVQREITVGEAAGRNVDNYKTRLDELQSGVLGPKALIAHATYEDADGQLRDLVPEIGSVYNHARDIMMTPEEIAAEPNLAAVRLQQLNDKIETDGLTKEEWNEYNQLNQTQEAKTELKPANKNKPQPFEAKPVGTLSNDNLATRETEISSLKPSKTSPKSKTQEPIEATEIPQATQEEGGLKTLSSEAGAPKTAKSAKDINKAAIDKGMSRGFKDLAEFTSTTEDYQKTGVKNLLQSDYEEATAVALGQKQGPSDLLPGMIFDAVKAQAKVDGDLDLMMKLAKSPLASQSSKLGQALGMTNRFDETNPTDLIKHVEDARAKAQEKAMRKTTYNDLKSIAKRTKDKMAIKDTWKDWLDSIPECEE